MKSWKQILVLGFAAALAAFASQALRKNPLLLDYPWSRHVEHAAGQKGMRIVALDEARQITENFSHLVLDARKPADFNAGHLPGALSLPHSQFDTLFASVSTLLTPEQPIMVYCSGMECDESIKLGEILINAGYTNIVLFAGGMNDWTKAGFPVEK